MANVEFQDESGAGESYGVPKRVLYSRYESSEQPPGMARFLIRFGLVKSEQTATYILLGLAILFFAASAYFFFFSGSSSKSVISQPNSVVPAAGPSASF